ncbi:MAG TPA: hypothetical protein VMI54_04410 [Polyangiaceae bacterium]|nr:hypothetical protein [Polyangiaceae bacterium]
MSRVVGLLVVIAGCLAACEPDLVVGKWTCLTSVGAAGPVDDAGKKQPVTEPLAVPWSTGFEDAFCGYDDAKGWCYGDQGVYTSVASPVHSGRRAAAFTVSRADGGGGVMQARCAREGTFPSDAYYGAWFYLPALPQSVGNWNLIHFQGENADESGWQGLWDVTLVKTSSGGFGLTLVEDFNGPALAQQHPPDIAPGAWFEVVVHWVRSSNATGEITLYEDDQTLVDLKGVTDPFTYDQWYVGNLVNATTEAELTVDVDDVFIAATR